MDSLDSFSLQTPRDPSSPELYPPRVLPKSLKRRPRDNRMIMATQPIEDRILFSGFHQEELHHDDKHRFRQLIGKHSVVQELDLNAFVHPSINANTDEPTATSTATSQNKSVNPSQVTLVGTALATFPLELRSHFHHMFVNSLHKSRLIPGQAVQRVYTPLGSFAFASNTTPSHFSSFDSKKQQTLKQAVEEVFHQVTLVIKPRYLTRFLQYTPPNQGIKKFNLSRSKVDDESSQGKKSKKSNEDDDEEDENINQSDLDDSDGDEESMDDDDYGFGNDDDDDDYGHDSGEDEPTF